MRFARVADHPGEIPLPEDLDAWCTPAQWGGVLELVTLLTAEAQTDCAVSVMGEFIVLTYQRGLWTIEASVWRNGAIDWFVVAHGSDGDSVARALARIGDPA